MSLTAISEIDPGGWGGGVRRAIVTGIHLARRSKGKPPEWLMAAAASGRVFVWDKLGVRHPEDEFDFGGTPVEAQISNSDPPLIALRSGTTVYVYREGVEIFNTGAITNLRDIRIGTSYLVTFRGGTLAVDTGYVEFRSTVDGSVITTISWAIDDRGSYFRGEASGGGDIAFAQYQDTSGSGWGHTVKVTRAGVQWNRNTIRTGGIPRTLRCSSDGDILFSWFRSGGWDHMQVLDGNNGLLDQYDPGGGASFAAGAEPNGAFGAWARIGTTTARIVESDASTHNIVLPSNIAGVWRAIDCFYGGYTGFLCVDGKIYFYDLDGDLVGAFDTEMYLHEIRGTTESASESLIRMLHKSPRPMSGVKSRLGYEVSP